MGTSWDHVDPKLIDKLKWEASEAGLRDEVVDKDDRLTLLRALIYYARECRRLCDERDEAARKAET